MQIGFGAWFSVTVTRRSPDVQPAAGELVEFVGGGPAVPAELAEPPEVGSDPAGDVRLTAAAEGHGQHSESGDEREDLTFPIMEFS